MIDVTLTDKKRFLVELDRQHPEYEAIYVLVRSLLTSFESKPLHFTVSYEDLIYFKQKLRDLGLAQEGKTISVEALDYLNQLQAEDARHTEIKQGADNERVSKLLEGKLKSTLFNDQLTGVAYLLHAKRTGLWDTMGSGKTLEILATLVALGDEIKKTLVVAPLGVLPGFKREVKRHTYLKSITLPKGRTKALDALKKHKGGKWDLLLVHPENLVGSKGAKFSPVLHMLLEMPWSVVIIDEFHKFKAVDAKRTRAVVKLVNESRNHENKSIRMIAMSGTPISEGPTNAYVFLKLTNYGRLPHVNRFESYFTVKQDIKYGTKGVFPKIVGYKNLDHLKTLVERHSIRRTKNDLTGFPPEMHTVRDVILTGKQADLYKSLKGQLIASLPKDTKINLAKILKSNAVAIRMRQVLNHPSFLNEAGDSAKYVELDGLLEELFSDKEAKVIVWTEYRKGVELLFDRYNAQYGVIKIYGGVDINEQLITSFEAKDGPRVAAAIPAKGGEGLDFLARARTSIYVDRPYSFTLYSQSLDRIVRRVSPEKDKLNWLDTVKMQTANLVFLDAVNTVDEIVRERLYGKQDLSDALLTDDDKLLEMGRADLIKLLK